MLSQGILGNDLNPWCVAIGMARYAQRWNPEFVPTDAMINEIFAAAGGGPDGLDPIATLRMWASGALPHLPPIAAWALIDPSDETQIIEGIRLTRMVMMCATLPQDAEDRFPASWNLIELTEPPSAGHCYALDGWDQTEPNALFDRATWGKYTKGGTDGAFSTKYGFCAMIALPASGLPSIAGSMLQAISNLGEVNES